MMNRSQPLHAKGFRFCRLGRFFILPFRAGRPQDSAIDIWSSGILRFILPPAYPEAAQEVHLGSELPRLADGPCWAITRCTLREIALRRRRHEPKPIGSFFWPKSSNPAQSAMKERNSLLFSQAVLFFLELDFEILECARARAYDPLGQVPSISERPPNSLCRCISKHDGVKF
jgi:hypothetical protein